MNPSNKINTSRYYGNFVLALIYSCMVTFIASMYVTFLYTPHLNISAGENLLNSIIQTVRLLSWFQVFGAILFGIGAITFNGGIFMIADAFQQETKWKRSLLVFFLGAGMLVCSLYLG